MKHMFKVIGVVGVAVFALGGAIPNSSADDGWDPPGPVIDKTPPCENEQTPGRCVWDGRHSGCEVTRSYVVRYNGKVVYIKHHRAHRLATTAR